MRSEDVDSLSGLVGSRMLDSISVSETTDGHCPVVTIATAVVVDGRSSLTDDIGCDWTTRIETELLISKGDTSTEVG